MATQIKSQQELYDLFIDAVQDVAPDLTDTEEGSKLDTLAGVVSFAGSEVSRVILDEFQKTFFSTAHGIEVTGSTDDLENLAVDHFGDAFARPPASPAEGVVTFSRPNTDAGNVTIPAGTIVKTEANANGESQRFATEIDVLMTGTSVNASVTAEVAGVDGNVLANTVTELESTLTDSSITVNNSLAFAGGEAEEDDATYRETIRNLITSLRGATKSAIEAKAKTVAGVETATAIETDKPVIEYNIGTGSTIGTFFRIPYVTLYIADANGVASGALVTAVKAAIEDTRAAGVLVNVLGSTALEVDWTLAITLNPSGPNFATLSADPQMILDSMEQYIQDLVIGADFVRATAEAAIMAIWGPAGTDDLTAVSTTVPVGDVTVAATQKAIAGDMEIA